MPVEARARVSRRALMLDRVVEAHRTERIAQRKVRADGDPVYEL